MPISDQERHRAYYLKNKKRFIERAKAWRSANIEKARENGRKNYAKNKTKIRSVKNKKRHENIEADRTYHREWYAKNREKESARKKAKYDPIKNRERQLRSKYNMSIEDYNNIFAKQNFSCAGCFSSEPKCKQGWRIDHNHSNGKIRGILCHQCNATLGLIKENTITLHKLIEYLDHHK